MYNVRSLPFKCGYSAQININFRDFCRVTYILVVGIQKLLDNDRQKRVLWKEQDQGCGKNNEYVPVQTDRNQLNLTMR